MLHEAISPATCNATNVALQVAKTIAGVTPHFCNAARQVAGCNMSSATCNVFHSSSLGCKLQKNLPCVILIFFQPTLPLGALGYWNKNSTEHFSVTVPGGQAADRVAMDTTIPAVLLSISGFHLLDRHPCPKSKWSVSLLFLLVRIVSSWFLAYMKQFSSPQKAQRMQMLAKYVYPHHHILSGTLSAKMQRSGR